MQLILLRKPEKVFTKSIHGSDISCVYYLKLRDPCPYYPIPFNHCVTDHCFCFPRFVLTIEASYFIYLHMIILTNNVSCGKSWWFQLSAASKQSNYILSNQIAGNENVWIILIGWNTIQTLVLVLIFLLSLLCNPWTLQKSNTHIYYIIDKIITRMCRKMGEKKVQNNWKHNFCD